MLWRSPAPSNAAGQASRELIRVSREELCSLRCPRTAGPCCELTVMRTTVGLSGSLGGWGPEAGRTLICHWVLFLLHGQLSAVAVRHVLSASACCQPLLLYNCLCHCADPCLAGSWHSMIDGMVYRLCYAYIKYC